MVASTHVSPFGKNDMETKTRVSEKEQELHLNNMVLALGIIQHLPSKDEKITKATQSLASRIKIPLVLICPVAGLSGSIQ